MKHSNRLIAPILTLYLVGMTLPVMADGGIKGWFENIFNKKDSTELIHPNLEALTIEENLAIPELNEKQAKRIKEIQASELERLLSIDYHKIETLRNEEVIRVTIPAEQLFAPNDTILRNEADSLLRPFLQCLRTPDYYHMLLVMHSDNTGNDAYTYALTTQRVLAVFNWLEINGAITDFVVPYAAGCHEPLAANNSARNRNTNRRLEIYLIPGEAMIKKR